LLESASCSRAGQLLPGVLVRGFVYGGSGYADHRRGGVWALRKPEFPVQLESVGAQRDIDPMLSREVREGLEVLKQNRVNLGRGELFQHVPGVWPYA
jgi:hypothetical protein